VEIHLIIVVQVVNQLMEIAPLQLAVEVVVEPARMVNVDPPLALVQQQNVAL
jgi:hypothetical protein